jgi:carbohydrate kinase (thermoresistant glucokinase family)
MIIVVMGVAACGKSTIGKLLAQQLSLPFIEADDFHSEKNILKMSSGIPLTDEDRYPWLQTLSQELKRYVQENGAVLACSALKEKYCNKTWEKKFFGYTSMQMKRFCARE